MRYLVAGGAGFIGSNLVERLLEDGHEVISMDNLLTGRKRNLHAFLQEPRFRSINHNVIEPLPELPELDAIFHLASPASPPGYQRAALETMRVNSEGTMHLLELAASKDAAFLYTSTSEIYGDPLVHPQTEDYRGNVSCIGPRSMYDESKRYGETLTALYERTRGVDARWVRIFNTYGPRSDPDDGRLVPNFITQCLRDEPITIYGDGTQTRSLCYVSDLVEGLVRVMSTPAAQGMPINLGNPDEHTVMEFAALTKELCCSDSELIFVTGAVGDDPQRRRPDISRARELLDWEPRVDLRTGLSITIEYFARELGVSVKV